MSKRNVGNTIVLEIPAFAATNLVNHGFSTRVGGVSEGVFASLDVGIYNNDAPEAVSANRRHFAQAVGIAPERIVCCHQVHKTHVAQVDSADCGRGFADGDTALADTDGLMTDAAQVGLMACFADCTPLFFLDPVRRVIAVSHAGWRGSVARMAVRTVERMREVYGCRPEDILAGIGPSIGSCHYEVDTPVIDQVRAAFDFWPQVLRFTAKDKARLDLGQINRLQLLEAGLEERHITLSDWCTYCHPELFYSYRRDHGQTGRMAALLALR